VNPGEGETIAADRTVRRTWLEARDYRVIEMRAADVERDIEAELVRLEGMIAQGSSAS
jgi:tRNA/rRNA methyltransferase